MTYRSAAEQIDLRHALLAGEVQIFAVRPTDEPADFSEREAGPAAGEDERKVVAVAAAVHPRGAVTLGASSRFAS